MLQKVQLKRKSIRIKKKPYNLFCPNGFVRWGSGQTHLGETDCYRPTLLDEPIRGKQTVVGFFNF